MDERYIKNFWKKVDKKDNSSCWIWIGAHCNHGYGQMRINNKMKMAHRISWIIHFGNIPEGLEVCHKCDNPECVNPSHLFLGTHQDNMDDRKSKGRNKSLQGEMNGASKLKNSQILSIRKKYSTGEYSLRDLGREYHVGFEAIRRVVKHISFTNV